MITICWPPRAFTHSANKCGSRLHTGSSDTVHVSFCVHFALALFLLSRVSLCRIELLLPSAVRISLGRQEYEVNPSSYSRRDETRRNMMDTVGPNIVASLDGRMQQAQPQEQPVMILTMEEEQQQQLQPPPNAYYLAVEKLTVLVATYGKPLLVAIGYHMVSDSLGSRLATLVVCVCALVAFLGFRVWLILQSSSSTSVTTNNNNNNNAKLLLDEANGGVLNGSGASLVPAVATAAGILPAVPTDDETKMLNRRSVGSSIVNEEALFSDKVLSSSSSSSRGLLLRKPQRKLSRRLQLSESFVSLVDLITSKKKRKKTFRLFPNGYVTQRIPRLATAPVEDNEQDDDNDNNHNHNHNHNKENQHHHQHYDDHEKEHKLTVSSRLNKKDDNNDHPVMEESSSVKSSSRSPSMEKATSSSSSSSPDSSEDDDDDDDDHDDHDDEGDENSVMDDTVPPGGNKKQNKQQVDGERPLPIIRRKRSSSITNVNPCAAYGVAAERLRIKMNAARNLNNINQPPQSALERQRFWRSLYAHAGIPTSVDQGGETYPLCPPLILATTFNIRSSGAWSDDDYFYSRISNPTRKALEETLALAEQGYHIEEDEDLPEGQDSQKCQAACFGSGMAAVSAALGAAASLMSNSPEKKVHIVVPKTCYDESVKQIQIGSGGYSSFMRVDMTDADAVNSALSKHPDRGKILFLETPDNPYTQVCDLEALVKTARSHNAVVIVDTTWSPPLIGQVFRYNVDAVCMSCTKTMGGHSDVLCGAVVTNGATRLGRKIFPRVRDWQICHGGVASPFDCWLVLRGLRTLPVRIERMCKTAMRLATFLENHPSIEWVRYPGLESHPQHHLAKKQMDMFGQICTFCIAGGSNAAMSFVGAVQLATRATSTGGTETLVQHQRSIEMVKVTPGGVIRVSVGLEDEDDLIEDFSLALQCAEQVCENLRVESWSPTDENE